MKRYAKISALLWLAFALRLYRLDAQSIWWDEGISLHLANSSLAEIVSDRAANIHPPLYFLALKGWVALAGSSAFGARFFSVGASLLQVALVFGVARRWFGRPTAWIAAFFTALAPLSIVYAQEIRVYAWLPLVYLALLALAHELGQGRGQSKHWLLLGLVLALGLHLHYMVVFGAAYAAGWLLLVILRARRWADLRRWALTHCLVGLSGLPWLAAVWLHRAEVQGRMEIGRGVAEPIPADYLLRQVWVFFLSGLNDGSRYGLNWLAALSLALLLCLLLLRLGQPVSRRSTAWMAVHWLLPLGAALLVWNVRSFSHPRYVALYAVGLTLLAARVLYPFRGRVSRILSLALAAALLLTGLQGLRAYLFDPALAKDDVKGVARYLQATAGPQDLVLIPDSDWSLPFVYQGQTPIEMPLLDDEERLWRDLGRWTAHGPQIFAIGYPQGTRDQRGVLAFALEKDSSLTTRQYFKGLFVDRYLPGQAIQPPELAPLGARLGPLVLSAAWVEAQAPANTALTLALRWRPETAVEQRYHLAIRLRDQDGWTLAAQDVLLLNEHDRPSDYWSAGQESTTYHVLPLPPDLPPLTYTLALGLYAPTEDGARPVDLLDEQGAPQGQRLDLAAVRLTPPLEAVHNPRNVISGPPALPAPVSLAEGLQLVGAALDRATLLPGQPLYVSLHWQAVQVPLPDLRPRLALLQGGQELASVESAPALGRYPTHLWQAGETVLDHVRLVVPPQASDGPAQVTLALGEQSLALGTVQIAAGERLFQAPPIAHPLNVRFSAPGGGEVARLIGYDLTYQAGEPIPLTLYWQAGTTSNDYTVFTHVLAADGHLVGQHDSPPANGLRPTGGWLAGEIIVDAHLMSLREPDYVGPAKVEVGLYDPLTGTRLVTEQGRDFFYLPLELTLELAP